MTCAALALDEAVRHVSFGFTLIVFAAGLVMGRLSK